VRSRAASLALRCHVEQSGGSRSVPVALVCRGALGGPSLTVAAEDIAPLARADCAAVLLPAAEFLGAEARAPGRGLLDAGALVALATDLNPGTAPVGSMPLVMGARGRDVHDEHPRGPGRGHPQCRWVLEMERTLGSTEVGKRADLLLLDGPVQRIADRLGHHPVLAAFVGGEPVYVRDAEAGRGSARGHEDRARTGDGERAQPRLPDRSARRLRAAAPGRLLLELAARDVPAGGVA
jgi:imidazolonepropionase